MKSILTIGEILVEIMAVRPGAGFREPIDLMGPFPSGAPAIFIDQVARLGAPAAMIGAVGEDDFGRLNVERLAADGVDVSAIAVHPGATTGSAFVRYRPDGARDFVFNIHDSANRFLRIDPAAEKVIAEAGHLHVVGSSLGAEPAAHAVFEALERVKASGGTVSFDPNIRKEMLGAEGLRVAMDRVLAATDLFLPSGDELSLFSSHADPEEAIADLLGRSVQAIVHKQGADGARYVDHNDDLFQPAFTVEEEDPTGAGDIFGATFVVGWCKGVPPAENLRLACAAGARAVLRKGPMEGVSTLAELTRFLDEQAGDPA
jgi:tagatose kinase